jgi:hypothetical protein
MKIKFVLLAILQFTYAVSFSQYVGVRARYTDTRLVDDNSPLPRSRENRLILYFYSVSAAGVYSPITLSNYDVWVYKEGFQYGSSQGGVLDSSGNNYTGYGFTAPQTVSYYNSYFPNYIDCDGSLTTHYILNGQVLDCGWVRVSHWVDGQTEWFTAPNVCLPYYSWPDPYSMFPGNINFYWPIPPTAPYNSYNFSCSGSTQQYVMRGVLPQDSSGEFIPLLVRFADFQGSLSDSGHVKLSWANLTESNVARYEIEKSVNGLSFQTTGTVFPNVNNGSRADYQFISSQTEKTVFYRIKAIENNNNILYSTIISLTASTPIIFNSDPVLSVYPNPVSNGQFTLRLTNAEKGHYSYSLISPAGQQLSYKLILHYGGDIIRQVDLTGLPKGVYQLLLRSETKKYTQKIAYVN